MDRKLKIKRKFGSAIVIILVLALLVGLLYLLVSILIREASRLIQDIPGIAVQLTKLLEKLSTKFTHIYDSLPEGLQTMLDGMNQNGKDYLSQFLEGVEVPSFTKAQGYLKELGNGFFMTIITVLATYFIIADHDKMCETANRVLPESIRRGYSLIASNFKTAVGGYFKAQFKIMAILMVVLFITFSLLGIGYALLLALVIGLIDLLPVFGTGFVFWPWTIIDLINGSYVRAIVILVLYLVCQIIKQVLQPKLVGDSIGISPFLALLFMFIGYRLQGFLGLIFGIPIGLVFVSFYRLGMFERILRGFKIIIADINEFRKY
jgi:sporulation integral membrane protein YtvI